MCEITIQIEILLLYYSEHRKMRAKQQHVCKEMNQYSDLASARHFRH